MTIAAICGYLCGCISFVLVILTGRLPAGGCVTLMHGCSVVTWLEPACDSLSVGFVSGHSFWLLGSFRGKDLREINVANTFANMMRS